MPTAAQITRAAAIARPTTTVIAPYPTVPVPIAPTTTIPQPNLGPDVGPVPLFSPPKPATKPLHKNPLFFIALAVAAWYFLG